MAAECGGYVRASANKPGPFGQPQRAVEDADWLPLW